MLKTVFQNRARYFLEPIENPFRAVTIYTENGRHEGDAKMMYVVFERDV